MIYFCSMERNKEIRNRISQIKSELNNRLASYELKSKTKEIFSLAQELSNPNGNASHAIFVLGDILQKEIVFVEQKEKEMLKHNAAKKRKTEFKELMNKAIIQIDLAVSSLMIED